MLQGLGRILQAGRILQTRDVTSVREPERLDGTGKKENGTGKAGEVDGCEELLAMCHSVDSAKLSLGEMEASVT